MSALCTQIFYHIHLMLMIGLFITLYSALRLHSKLEVQVYVTS